ncbi:MAG: hypothetical protein IT251_00770 [Chitinophagaceae bacterium]|nr:hypothetical protein [Chitinophagaceae bacterium]
MAILLYGNKNSSRAKIFSGQVQLSYSTLDSLQGIWVRVNDVTDEVDTTCKIKINNRLWISEFLDDNVFVRDTSLIYFSDTVIIGDTILFSQIDTAAVSGNYILDIMPLQNGQGYENHGTWEILGIVKIEGEIYFSMWPAPYGTARQTQSFKKVQ